MGTRKYFTEEERKEANRAKVRRWMARNPDYIKAARKRYAKLHPEHGRKARAKYAKRNPEKMRAYVRAYDARNREARRAARKAHNAKPEVKARRAARDAAKYAANAEVIRQRSREYTAANPEKKRAWREANKPAIKASWMRRELGKIKATPSWANDAAIEAIYAQSMELSKQTGIVHHVDHIVPLRSKLVCGLHWEGNLQVLTGKANLAKSNRTWPDMW